MGQALLFVAAKVDVVATTHDATCVIVVGRQTLCCTVVEAQQSGRWTGQPIANKRLSSTMKLARTSTIAVSTNTLLCAQPRGDDGNMVLLSSLVFGNNSNMKEGLAENATNTTEAEVICRFTSFNGHSCCCWQHRCVCAQQQGLWHGHHQQHSAATTSRIVRHHAHRQHETARRQLCHVQKQNPCCSVRNFHNRAKDKLCGRFDFFLSLNQKEEMPMTMNVHILLCGILCKRFVLSCRTHTGLPFLS